MTYPEKMARWRSLNRRLWPLLAMTILAPFAFVGLIEISDLPWIVPLIGLGVFWVLSSNTYGNLTDELVEASSLADDVKMERFIEDLGQYALSMPLMNVVSNQEMGNFRFPSRIMFTVKGINHLVVYDWEKRRFARYKWPLLPYSLSKTLERAKSKT